jgi:hypothetical protein
VLDDVEPRIEQTGADLVERDRRQVAWLLGHLCEQPGRPVDHVSFGQPAPRLDAAHRDGQGAMLGERGHRERAPRGLGSLIGRDLAIAFEHCDGRTVGKLLEAAVGGDRAPQLVLEPLVVLGRRSQHHHGQEPPLAAARRARTRCAFPRRHGRGLHQGAERRQRGGQVGAVARAQRGFLRQRLRDQRVQVPGHLGPQLAHPRRGAEQDLGQDGGGGVAVERRDTGQALEQHAAEREHVGAGVDRFAGAGLLGGHVTGGPEHRAGPGERGAPLSLGDPEVEHLDQVDAASGEHQVGRLEIAVDDSARVRGAKRFGDPGRERDGLAQGEWPPPEASLEVFAVDPLHGKESLSRGRHAVRDIADDARVGELREDLDLAREALGEMALLAGDDLDGHHLPRDRIARAKHRSHAAAADRLLDREPVTEQLPGRHEGSSLCSASGRPGLAATRMTVRGDSGTPPSCTECRRSQMPRFGPGCLERQGPARLAYSVHDVREVRPVHPAPETSSAQLVDDAGDPID